MARARIERAVANLGAVLVHGSPSQLDDALASQRPDLLILDLDGGGPDLLAALAQSRPSTRVVGYYSHIDTELGDAARRAGCEPIPRGRFWRSLEDIIGH